MLPQAPATYALLLHSSRYCRLQIGRLGGMQVQPGYYIYLGSAFGPGGLGGRLAHHFKPAVSSHWHIDYLRGAAEVIEVWAAEGPEKREHAWALALASCPACSLPLPRFGASDCRCPAHLFFLPTQPNLEWFSTLVHSSLCIFYSDAEARGKRRSFLEIKGSAFSACLRVQLKKVR